VFSVIWGICFSLKANPNGMKRSDSGTLLAQGTRLLRADASKASDSAKAVNSRVRDLVDMVLLVHSGTLSKAKIAEAIRVTFDRRGTHTMPNVVPRPPAEWQKPYDALARECNLSGQVEDAFAGLREFMELIFRS
jgi:hypothetical protein